MMDDTTAAKYLKHLNHKMKDDPEVLHSHVDEFLIQLLQGAGYIETVKVWRQENDQGVLNG